MVSIPNLVGDADNIEENSACLLDRLGFRAEVLRTEGNPFVYGGLRVAGATRIVLLNAPVRPSHPDVHRRRPDGRESCRDLQRPATATVVHAQRAGTRTGIGSRKLMASSASPRCSMCA